MATQWNKTGMLCMSDDIDRLIDVFISVEKFITVITAQGRPVS